MARGKKKEKELSPEERLQQARVPDSEQPYRVPENWCWFYGKSFLLPMETKRPTGEFFKYIDIDSINNKNQVVSEPKIVETEKAPSRASRMLHPGDTVFSMVRPYLKNIAYIDDSIADSIASTGFYICTPRKNVLAKYNYYMMISPYVVDGLNAFMKGDNSPSIRKEDLEWFPYPIPPLPEQQRIVDRIESLFAKLDEAKEKAQAVVDRFEGIKQSFLYQSFSGNITKKWRKKNRIKKDQTWELKNLQSVCSMKITDGTHKTPTYCEAEIGIPFISAKDVTSGVICWDNIKYIIPELHDELYERLAPQVDDVLLAKNGTTGVAAIVEEEKIFDLYVTLAVLRPNKDIIEPRYLLNVVNSPICKRQFDDHLTGIGVPNLHLRDIKEVLIPLPSLEEQKEIVRVVDSMSKKWSETQTAAEMVLGQINTMKKSVLARAFRGKLGTNDPTDESAEEMLKSLLNDVG